MTMKNIKVFIEAEFSNEKTKYDPKRLEKSLDKEYL